LLQILLHSMFCWPCVSV